MVHLSAREAYCLAQAAFNIFYFIIAILYVCTHTSIKLFIKSF